MTKRWRFSLRHFMILGACMPPLAALGAGVFGRLPQIVFWIFAILFLWYGALCGIVQGAAYLKGKLNQGIEQRRSAPKKAELAESLSGDS